MNLTIDAEAQQGASPAMPDAAILERLHALGVTTVRLAADRDDALARARAARAESAAQYRVNLGLQRHLDEYNADRRAYEATIADLEVELGLARAALAAADGPRRGRWRR